MASSFIVVGGLARWKARHHIPLRVIRNYPLVSYPSRKKLIDGDEKAGVGSRAAVNEEGPRIGSPQQFMCAFIQKDIRGRSLSGLDSKRVAGLIIFPSMTDHHYGIMLVRRFGHSR